jgi:hypothetical protein
MSHLLMLITLHPNPPFGDMSRVVGVNVRNGKCHLNPTHLTLKAPPSIPPKPPLSAT